MENYFVISDIHGQYKAFMKLLRQWNPDNERLVLLGDYVDRGPDSFKVLQEVHNRAMTDDAHVNSGNHEKLFLSFLEDPDEEALSYFGAGGDKTIRSFLREKLNENSPHLRFLPKFLANKILDEHPELIAFIENMPLYLETPDWIFTHAGINPDIIQWRNSTEKDFLNIRHRFHYGKNETGKNIMFGHTTIQKLPHYQDGMKVWKNHDGTLFGIDGGAGSNRLLNGVKIKGNELVSIYQEDCSFVK